MPTLMFLTRGASLRQTLAVPYESVWDPAPCSLPVVLLAIPGTPQIEQQRRVPAWASRVLEVAQADFPCLSNMRYLEAAGLVLESVRPPRLAPEIMSAAGHDTDRPLGGALLQNSGRIPL